MINLPNLFTLLNLLSGCLAVIAVTKDEPATYFILLCISLASDFLDGWVARKTQQTSLLGLQLDSLADMISFGLVPALIVFVSLQESDILGWADHFLALYAFIITLGAALRLAKFNFDIDQQHTFKGLATPAVAIGIAGAWFGYSEYNLFSPFINMEFGPILWIVLVPLAIVLMLSSIPMLSFKSFHSDLKARSLLFILVIISILLFAAMNAASCLPIIALYILLSCFYWLTKKS